MKSTLKKLEDLQEIILLSNYIIRYEQGKFQSGWCLLEKQKIVILNKFLNTEDRIQILEEKIGELEINKEILPSYLVNLYNATLKKKENLILFSNNEI